MTPERQQHILDILDDRLASYDEYRRQLDHELAAEDLVLSGLQEVVRHGWMTQPQLEEEVRIFHERST